MTSFPYHPVDYPPLSLSSIFSQMSHTHAITSTSEVVLKMKSDQASQESSTEQNKDDEQAAGANQVRSYGCTFCKRGFSNAQALGGHMNIHRKDKAKLMTQSTADYEIGTHHCPHIPKQLPLFAEFPSGRIQKPEDALVHVKTDDKGFSVDRSFLLEQSYLDLELRLGGPVDPHAPTGRPATKKFF